MSDPDAVEPRSPDKRDEELNAAAIMGAAMDQFTRAFEASARRWELVVYPSMLAFIILAAYGFYLIFKLTNDVDQITQRIETIAVNMINVDEYMFQVATNMDKVANNMNTMARDMQTITVAVTGQRQDLSDLASNIRIMNQTMGNMTATMHQMRFDTANMGRNMESVSGPMRFMNNFMPW